MEDFLIGAGSAALGVCLITRRKQFAAGTVRQQNWLLRKNYGPRGVKRAYEETLDRSCNSSIVSWRRLNCSFALSGSG